MGLFCRPRSGSTDLIESGSETLNNCVVFSLPRLQADTIRELAWGRDESEVKMSGRTASIGLEDRQVYSSVANPIGFGKFRLLHAVPAFSEQE